jgi:hypothetical protein
MILMYFHTSSALVNISTPVPYIPAIKTPMLRSFIPKQNQKADLSLKKSATPALCSFILCTKPMWSSSLAMLIRYPLPCPGCMMAPDT